MNTMKNRTVKRSIAFMLVLLVVSGILPVTASTDYPEADLSGAAVPTNTPRPEVMLLASEISAESAALSAQLYNNFLGYDPALFLLTEEGIKNLGWNEVGTEEEFAYIEEMAYRITEGCSTADEKIFAVVEYIAQNVGYDYDYLESNDIANLALSPWDVLQKEATVCEGYARTTAALLQILDIPCIYADAPNHKWNLMYNGERWMLIDPTWISGSRYENGVLTKSDDLWMDWYDFTIEQANSDYNHTIEELALSVIDGVLTNFPYHTRETDVVIPSNVHTIDTWITYKGSVIETVCLPKSVTTIGEVSFYFGNTLKTIYYQGTASAFSGIVIGRWNPNFTQCTDIRYLDEVSDPLITLHPADLYTAVGASAVLSAGVYYDTGTLTCQWYESASRSNENGTPIAGAVSTSLTIVPETVGEKYYYLEATVTDPSVSGTGTKSVKTVPCKVRVFEEIPSEILRIGSDAVMYVLPESGIVYMEGSGDAAANWRDIPAGSTVYIDKDITSIANAAETFIYAKAVAVESGSSRLMSDAAGALYDIEESALLALPGYTSVTDYTVLDGTKTICKNAIRVSLATISLPKSLEVIEGQLTPNRNLRKITVDEGNTNFYIDAYGALIDKTGRRIVVYPSASNIIDEYVIPDGILYIEDSAFLAAKIRSLKCNDDLISIGDDAFFNSNHYSKIVFPATLKEIGNSAFSYNQFLTDVYFKGDVPEEWGTEVFLKWADKTPVTIHYASDASGWSTPVWKHPNDTETYSAYPYETGDVKVNSVGAAFTTDGQVVTVKEETLVCKVGYLNGSSYTALPAVQNSDGSYSFTAPDHVEEVLVVIAGDINADGKLDTNDRAVLNQVLLKNTAMDAKAAFAADVNGDGTVKNSDKTKLNAVIFGKTMLTWN